jgi:alpha-tubulin suppressor-like RCC1 family protein
LLLAALLWLAGGCRRSVDEGEPLATTPTTDGAVDPADAVEEADLADGGEAADGDSEPAEANGCPVDHFRSRTRCVSRVVNLSATEHGTCAVLQSGEVWCWGGTAFATRPAQIPGITSARQISANSEGSGSSGFSCAATREGQALCWGGNAWGVLGVNDPRFERRGTPAPVVTADGNPLTGVQQVAVGGTFACAATTHGIHCWGENTEGQLGVAIAVGDGVKDLPGSSPLIHFRPYAGLVADVPSAFVGVGYEIAMSADGKGRICGWGGETSGHRYWPVLDDTTFVNGIGDPVPRCRDTRKVVQIGGGFDGVCTRDDVGTVACWGYDLGPDDVPGARAAIPAAVDLTTGQEHACAAVRDGRVFCWGRQKDGVLGNGSLEAIDGPPRAPQAVSGLEDAIGVGSGPRASHTCAIHRDGSVSCWGQNSHGQLGNVSAPRASATPVKVEWD